jgi:hypothetical protein
MNAAVAWLANGDEGSFTENDKKARYKVIQAAALLAEGSE